MTRTKRDWRAHLTEAERDQLARIERAIAEADNLIAPLKWKRHKIQNRATTRARMSDERAEDAR
jgi:hypothetical protein